MISNLSAVGRKMVTIVDPHIRRDDEYYVYKQAVDGAHLVLNNNGAVYEGWCWPGTCTCRVLLHFVAVSFTHMYYLFITKYRINAYS